ncbi:poly(A) polymerase [Mitosporidium daphniae]|uniref:Poly(A) polymerase n=1 Tax=Mitosporidium daphniae TaxID=1485682 RepID=A0A098VMX2_9MICR|nr:poly(A) polymerase [Mitosporidium daphniae]KGG50368.1 poly(A) polymerase [Mitosporidium daphniae]|eukprot:XP_013236795.1 poly(A) polymerase [Mitosporidium daphniae]
MSESEASETGGKIYTFGSYRLGVHAKGADIDTLCIVPIHVSRQDFFGPFFEELKGMNDVTEITRVPEAYVPIMKLIFDGISVWSFDLIDLLFCRLHLEAIPDNLNLLNNSLLKNLDEKCTLSINGSRTTDEILSLVPNVPTFHTALRCVKFWAQRMQRTVITLGRSLYSNVMGYVGGVACAILVARICQLYPNSSAFRVVSRFFAIYYSWKWPQPIMLKHIEDYHLNMRVWNPRVNPSDRNHRMPIITPAYPSMCSTHNVSNSTLRVMIAELERGAKICIEIENGHATWADLFAPSDFFARFRHFIQIVGVCKDQEKFKMWSGFVESKIRLLVLKLEQVMALVSAPPYPEGFEKTLYLQPDEHVFKYLQYLPQPDQQDVNKETTTEPTFTISFYIALEIQPPNGMPFDDVGSRKLNLSIPVAEFQRLCLGWDKYDSEMKLYIREIKRFPLALLIC